MSLALFMTLVAAAPSEEQITLLKQFRAEFVLVTPGKEPFSNSFVMGRDSGRSLERPAHEVTIREPFSIAKYEVTQNLWEAVMGSNPSRWKGPRNSVEMLSFDEAQEFCRRATDLMRQLKLIEPNEQIRLPSESEWEYAARAGTSTLFSFGDEIGSLGEYGWFNGNAKGNDPPVGAKKPNAAGLFDVHGYLWEWCQDPWHDNYEGAPSDGSVWAKDGDMTQRVLRGGSWKDPAEWLTTTFRRGAPVSLRDDAVGLRCVLGK